MGCKNYVKLWEVRCLQLIPRNFCYDSKQSTPTGGLYMLSISEDKQGVGQQLMNNWHGG